MSEALSIAASGLKSEEYYIEAIANDLANLNTNNYKASKIRFEDVLYQNISGSQASYLRNQSASIGLGSSVANSTKDFSPGPLKASNNWNNVAIDGQGFFQVENSEGNLIYTRNSSLQLDEERYLSTADGYRLADNIQIPEDFTQIIIQKNGDVEAHFTDNDEPQLIGTIKLAKFLAPEALKPLGNGLYQATEQAGEAISDSPGTAGLGQLLQKQVEGSNVDMVHALMELTMAQRVYQLNAKAVQIADELEKMTNEIRS